MVTASRRPHGEGPTGGAISHHRSALRLVCDHRGVSRPCSCCRNAVPDILSSAGSLYFSPPACWSSIAKAGSGSCARIELRAVPIWWYTIRMDGRLSSCSSSVSCKATSGTPSLLCSLCALLTSWCRQTVFYNQGKWVPNSDIWRTIIWMPGWTAFWLATWSLCVSREPPSSPL